MFKTCHTDFEFGLAGSQSSRNRFLTGSQPGQANFTENKLLKNAC